MQKLLRDFDFHVAMFALGRMDASTMAKAAFSERIGTDIFMQSMVVIVSIGVKSKNKLECRSISSKIILLERIFNNQKKVRELPKLGRARVNCFFVSTSARACLRRYADWIFTADCHAVLFDAYANLAGGSKLMAKVRKL